MVKDQVVETVGGSLREEQKTNLDCETVEIIHRDVGDPALDQRS